MTYPELATARLALRRPVEADIDAILALHDVRTCAHNPGDLLASRAEAVELVGRWRAHWDRYGFGYWLVCPRGGGEPLGVCGVKVMTLHGREVLNLLYRFAPEHWGRGYAGEAVAAVLAWASRQAPEWPLIARIRPANTASIRVATGAGLVHAAHLDTDGEDGPDLIFVTRWPSADR